MTPKQKAFADLLAAYERGDSVAGMLYKSIQQIQEERERETCMDWLRRNCPEAFSKEGVN